VRRGRKAAGLLGKMAELPKDETTACSAFLFCFVFGDSGESLRSKPIFAVNGDMNEESPD